MNFKIGGVVIGQHFIYGTQYNGMEGTIRKFVSPDARLVYAHNKMLLPLGAEGASVNWSDGTVCTVKLTNLRLKKPPQETTDWAAQQVQKLLNNIPQMETV